MIARSSRNSGSKPWRRLSHRTEESQADEFQTLRFLIDHVDDIVLQMTQSHQIVFVNEAWPKLLGLWSRSTPSGPGWRNSSITKTSTSSNEAWKVPGPANITLRIPGRIPAP
jgi:hypothetical protein